MGSAFTQGAGTATIMDFNPANEKRLDAFMDRDGNIYEDAQ